MPNAQTVAIESIFAMLNMGYSTIYLYGVDHTFLEGLKVMIRMNLYMYISIFMKMNQK